MPRIQAKRRPDFDADIKAAQKFLDLIGPTAKSWTFQTFDDERDATLRKGKLARILHGTLAEHADELASLNRQGAGIFATVNRTDGEGRKKGNITHVRAVTLDLDGPSLDPVLRCLLKAHVIVESSPKRYHAYWRVKGLALNKFEDVQRSIAKRFDGDPDVAKLTHCARLPGFDHCKDARFRVRILEVNELRAYDAEQILAEFPPESKPHKQAGGSRNVIIVPAGAPTEAADKFVEHRYLLETIPLLRHYRGAFYLWTGTHHREYREEALERDLYAFLKGIMARKPNDDVAPFNPTKSKVSEVVHALRRSDLLLPGDWETPFWLRLPGEKLDYRPADDMIACGNGILNLKTRDLIQHIPLFFSPNCLPFDYDVNAPKPKRFFAILDSLEMDQETEDALQEIFGYLLTSDTQQQKIFLIVGPKRGGKGTLVWVLEQLLGKDNIVYQTLDSLTGEFGRWPLIDKKLAVFADARLGSRGNIHRLVETLLSISGGDPQTINRKFGEFWTGRLGVRFLITTNVLPALKDASGTIASRFIMMRLTKTFFGREDLKLKTKLAPDLPGILNWALDGLDRLRRYGHFQQPKSSEQSIQMLEDLAAPVGAFLREWCVIDPELGLNVKELYRAYKAWAEDTGQKAQDNSQFGKQLRDVVPTLITKGRGTKRSYVGITLSDEGDKAWAELLEEKGKTKTRTRE